MIKNEKQMMEELEEIKFLYNVSEAEFILLLDLMLVVKSIGHSPKLTIKLLKVLVAQMEVIQNHISKE